MKITPEKASEIVCCVFRALKFTVDDSIKPVAQNIFEVYQDKSIEVWENAAKIMKSTYDDFKAPTAPIWAIAFRRASEDIYCASEARKTLSYQVSDSDKPTKQDFDALFEALKKLDLKYKTNITGTVARVTTRKDIKTDFDIIPRRAKWDSQKMIWVWKNDEDKVFDIDNTIETRNNDEEFRVFQSEKKLGTK
jgi:hypothetical protein